MDEMILTADMGNSALKLGLFKGRKLARTARLARGARAGMAGQVRAFVGKRQAAGAICSCVVPALESWLARTLGGCCRGRVLKLSHHLELGMRIEAEPAGAVGADRLANAVAARFDGPLPCLVVDYGTMTTFNVVSCRGVFLGGAIAPGLGSCAEVMSARGARLPRLRPRAPGQVIGRNTAEAMLSGLVYGQLGQLSGMVERVEGELGEKVRLLATGGYAPLMARAGAAFDKLDVDLTLKGLRLVYELNQ